VLATSLRAAASDASGPFIALGAAGDDARAERVVAGFEGGALALDGYLFHPAS
jgi:hypothetical protein